MSVSKLRISAAETGFSTTIDKLVSSAKSIREKQRHAYRNYEGESISKQPVPFPMDRDGHDFHALFQYMFYT